MYYYGFKKDDEGNLYKIFILEKAPRSFLIENKDKISLDITGSDHRVLNDYWSRLSTKAVQYSAGVIDLFFKEVEREKENKTKIASEKPKSFFAAIIGFVDAGVGGLAEIIRGVFTPNAGGDVSQNGASENTLPQSAEVPVEDQNSSGSENSSDELIDDGVFGEEPTQTEKLVAPVLEKNSRFTEVNTEEDSNLNDVSLMSAGDKKTVLPPSESEINAPPKESRFFDVRINEIMYDAQGSDTGKEWIEVLNYEWQPVDICGWKFFENGVAHKLNLARGFCTVSPGGYAVIVRDEVGFFEMYPWFRGTVFTSAFSLSNSGERIALKNGNREIDFVEYLGSFGAKGDGNSLQRTSNGWYARIPTPGSENALTGGGSGATNGNTSVTGGTTDISTSTTNELPHPRFSFSPASPLEKEDISFDASLSDDVDGTVTSYTWDFGDGFASSTASSSIRHSYSAAGDYMVRLAVMDDADESDSTSTLIKIIPLIETATTTPVAHLVISEIAFDAEGSDTGKEFIELYNPTDATSSLDGWALRYSLGDTTTSETLALFDASSGDETNVLGRGFLLVGFSNYDSANFDGTEADIMRSRSLSNGSSAIVKISLVDHLGQETDSITYGSSSIASAGQSLERKSVVNDFCSVAEGLAEFSGNACDRDSSYDFSIRNIPHPQNSGSLIESRGMLIAPSAEEASSTVRFDKDSMSLKFAWRTATSSDSRAVISYRIADVSSGTPALAEATTTTSTVFSAPIIHIGREYGFEMRAYDQEGLASATSSYSIPAPSFFSGLYPYPDPREEVSGRYAIDAYYNAFPFVPDLFGKGLWQGLVFYADRGVDETNKVLVTANGHAPEEMDGVLRVAYSGCIGGAEEVPVGSFIFPLGAEWCGLGGGLNSSSFDYTKLEDKHFIIHSASSSAELGFSSNDYITIAYYAFESSGGDSQNLSLVAIDDTKFFFQDDPPSQYAPEIGIPMVSFDEMGSKLSVSWNRGSDLDSIDSELVYELNFTPLVGTSTILDEILWNTSTTQLLYEKTVAPTDAFLLGVRARDDFGNISSVATTTWSYPTTNFSITQEASDAWSSVWGTVNHSTAEPDTASFQSFAPQENFLFNKAVVKVRQTLVNDVGNLRLAVYPANASGTPEFASPLGEAVLASVLNPDETQEQTFTFESSISVTASSTYWLVLDLASYSDGSGYFRNGWQNAIAGGGGAYEGGIAGMGYARGANAMCSGCFYERIYTSGPADWYFKLGLKE